MEIYLACLFLGYLAGCDSAGVYSKSELYTFSDPRFKLMYFVADDHWQSQSLQKGIYLPFSTPAL